MLEGAVMEVLSFKATMFVKFIYSEKATKFCEIFPLLLTVCAVVKSKGETVVKSKGKIS